MSDSELTVANRGIWIPSQIWENKGLSIQEKALLARIHSYDECFASNQFLADFLGLSVARTKAIITSLVRSGYLHRQEEKQGSITVRRILSVDTARYYGVERDGVAGIESNPRRDHIQSPTGIESNTHSYKGLVKENSYKDLSKDSDKPCEPGFTDDIDFGEIVSSRRGAEEASHTDQPKGLTPATVSHTSQAKSLSVIDNNVKEIFEFWRDTMCKTMSTKLDAKRRTAIKNRLKDGYDVDYIKTAIVKCSQTPHNMGHNDRKQKYNDIELICRNASNLERFAESNPGAIQVAGQSNQPSANAQTGWHKDLGVF